MSQNSNSTINRDTIFFNNHHMTTISYNLFWRCGTINVRSLQELANPVEISHTIDNIQKSRLDICALQETRMLGKDCLDFDDYQMHWSGFIRK